MPRWLLSAAVLTLAVSFPSASATAGLFSHGHDDCAPSCAAPLDSCAPACAAPTATYVQAPSCVAPIGPTCCAPEICAPDCAVPYNYVETGCCEAVPCEVERECYLKRGFRKLMDLERRKNRCLRDTFFGWCDDDDCHETDCAPLYYYEADCAVPGCAVPY